MSTQNSENMSNCNKPKNKNKILDLVNIILCRRSSPPSPLLPDPPNAAPTTLPAPVEHTNALNPPPQTPSNHNDNIVVQAPSKSAAPTNAVITPSQVEERPVTPLRLPSNSEETGENVYAQIISKTQTATWSGRALDVFKSTMEILKVAGFFFPPLELASSGCLKLVERAEQVTSVHSDFQDISKKIAAVSTVLQGYNYESLPEIVRRHLQQLVDVLNAQQAFIQEKLKTKLLSRVLDTEEDGEVVKGVLAAVDLLLTTFIMDVSLGTAAITGETREDVRKLVSLTLLEKLNHASRASYISSSNEGCLDGTRVSVLNDIFDWASNWNGSDGVAPILWLSGHAGAGKTTIITTTCRGFKEHRTLFTSFMCSRRAAAEQLDAKRIIPTLAHTLASQCPLFSALLVSSLQKDPSIALTTSISEQLQSLFETPFAMLKRHLSPVSLRLVIVIDGLDECSEEKAVSDLLRALLQLCNRVDNVKLLLACRPEPEIRSILNRSNDKQVQAYKLSEVQADTVTDDIYRYLKAGLSDIRSWHESFTATDCWPPESEVKALAEQAGGLFIYASTAMTFIGSHKEDPRSRLRDVINSSRHSDANGTIDALYALILTEAFEGLSSKGKDDILVCLRCLATIQGVLSLRDFALISELQVTRVRTALTYLHSVIQVPPIGDDVGTVAPYHASFFEFLADPDRTSRDKSWFVDKAAGHELIAGRCLSIMNSDDLLSVAGRNPQKRHPTYALYSCNWWIHHLERSLPRATNAQTMASDYLQLLKTRFPVWLEAIVQSSNNIGPAVGILMRFVKYLEYIYPKDYEAISFVKNGLIFSFRYRDRASLRAESVYTSALALDISPIGKMFEQHFISPYTWHLYGKPVERWSLPQDRDSLQANFTALAVLPRTDQNGPGSPFHHITTGSESGFITVWDGATGQPIKEPFQAHERTITCLGYSNDGKYLASGSKDGTAKVWDTQTWKTIGSPIAGHGTDGAPQPITAVFFPSQPSQADCVIVATEGDDTMQVWNARTGQLLRKSCTARECVGSSTSRFSHSPDEVPPVCADWEQETAIRNVEVRQVQWKGRCLQLDPRQFALSLYGGDCSSLTKNSISSCLNGACSEIRSQAATTATYCNYGCPALTKTWSPKMISTMINPTTLRVVSNIFNTGGNDVYVWDIDAIAALEVADLGTANRTTLVKGYSKLVGQKDDGGISGLAISSDGKYVVSCNRVCVRVSVLPEYLDRDGSGFRVHHGDARFDWLEGQPPFTSCVSLKTLEDTKGVFYWPQDALVIAPVTIRADWDKFKVVGNVKP